jgi:hypothetical protein
VSARDAMDAHGAGRALDRNLKSNRHIILRLLVMDIGAASFQAIAVVLARRRARDSSSSFPQPSRALRDRGGRTRGEV